MRRPALLLTILSLVAACSGGSGRAETTTTTTTTLGTSTTSGPVATSSTTTERPTTTTQPSATAAEVAAFFAEHGGTGAFGQVAVFAVTNYLLAEEAVQAGDLATARDLIDAVWNAYPPGSDRWGETPYIVDGTHLGGPAAYYGIRMLDDVVDHLLAAPAVEPTHVDFVIVLVACSEGIRATTAQDLLDGTGEMVSLSLDPRLDGNEEEWFEQATWAFRQYVTAMTGGRLVLDLRIDHLDVCIPIETRQFDVRVASAWDYSAVWDGLDPSIAASGSWLWVLNPSAVPTAAAIADLEYITGGMGLHPNGAPAFLSDDLWVVRKPPHLGEGEWSDVERRAYMPQWLMHEFFHHLYRQYPEFGLEAVGHQWFDRSTWPDDFVGQFEPDYYAESLHKRLLEAEPPLHVALRYDAPSEDDYAALTADDLIGTYRREPVENGYHTGTIARQGDGFVWRNEAGVAWSLSWAPGDDRLVVGPDGVYNDAAGGEAFVILLEREGDGFGAVTGFRFLGEVYTKG